LRANSVRKAVLSMRLALPGTLHDGAHLGRFVAERDGGAQHAFAATRPTSSVMRPPATPSSEIRQSCGK
jgi:hypothetical protein